MNYYLAIDIGASSGRHILFWREQQTIHMQEIYRFVNETKIIGKYECWDTKKLFYHIKEGMKVCQKRQKLPFSMAIDTWGVDYVLLDHANELLEECICYRDHSFDHAMEDVLHIISKEELYKHTGIQFQQFNTIYQLHELAKRMDLTKAHHFLMMPDYMNFLLSGIFTNEYSNATTTQLINAKTKIWDETILKRLQIPQAMFHDLMMPGTRIGPLREEVVQEIGYQTTIWACASHDTGSAFLVAKDQNSVIISSGTWSLIGIHRDCALINEDSYQCNYTNEGGWHTIRFLKNIMGLWLMQELQRDLHHAYSFQTLCEMGERSEAFDTVIDVNDPCFLKPDHMMQAINEYCEEHHMMKPKSIGQYVQCICRSLAVAYNVAIEELEQLNQKHFESITVIGGGVQNEYLNDWIAKICHKKVIRGVVEATALGNAICQMYANGEFESLDEARACECIVHEKERI